MPFTIEQSSTKKKKKILAKAWAFQLDKLLPHLISQDWAVFISECKISGNLRRLLMSLSSLMLLKHCYIVTMEPEKTVLWNRTQKWWILTKFGCKENIFHNWIQVFSAICRSSSTAQPLMRSLLAGWLLKLPEKSSANNTHFGLTNEPSNQRHCFRITQILKYYFLT